MKMVHNGFFIIEFLAMTTNMWDNFVTAVQC